MKRMIVLVLVLVLAFSLVACTGSAGGNVDTGDGGNVVATGSDKGFRVGFARANITPDGQVGLGGYGRVQQRLSTSILSYLYVTCVAISDAEDNTILLYGMDLLTPDTPLTFRSEVSEATGVPEANIIMSASHTHSSPAYSFKGASGTEDARNKLRKGLIDSAVEAMADRKPAQIYGGSIETEGFNFVRHYICNDGTYCGDSFGDDSSGLAGHATEADSVLQAVKFVREGDNEVWITNFQTHPHQTGGSTACEISADVVGELRENLQKDLGIEVVYISGASGNINSHTRIGREKGYSDWRDWGKKMANYAKQIEFTQLNTGKVQVTTATYVGKINHEDDKYLAICSYLFDRWNNGEITTAEVITLGAEAGIKLNSPHHAGGILTRAGMPETKSFDIQAFSFGDVGLVSAPYEMFDTNGMFIKENSPFAMTVVATCSNGGEGYFPSDFTFTYGSYETDTTPYVRGTAEELASQFVAMLTEQYNNR